MNKNAIYYNLYINDKISMSYYSMLYYSLETLSKFYDESFDVIVFYTIKNVDVDINTYQHLDQFNLINDFKFVKFIESRYSQDYNINFTIGEPNTHDPWMGKWYHLPKAIELGYEKVFFLDVDTVFYKNPSYLFDKYPNKNEIPTGFSGDRVGMMFVSAPPINSGQFIVHQSLIPDTQTFYDDVISNRCIMNAKAAELLKSNKITQDEYRSFIFFNEQYCGQLTLENVGAKFIDFDWVDIVTPAYGSLEKSSPPYAYTVSIIDKQFIISNVNTAIIHYSGSQSGIMIPDRLKTEGIESNYQYNFNRFHSKLCKNKRVIFYSLYIFSMDSLDHYSMLYNSLSTLNKFHHGQFDIVVNYSTPAIDFKNYNHLGKYNLVNDFPKVTFVDTEYCNVNSDIFLHKWFSFEKMLSMDYDQYFYIDSDSIFMSDPTSIFDQHDDGKFYGSFEGPTDHVPKLIGVPQGVNGGQYVFNKKSVSVDNLYIKVKIQLDELKFKSDTLWPDDKSHAAHIKHLAEQYAAQKVLIDHGTVITQLSVDSIAYGECRWRLVVSDQEANITDLNCKVVHYFGGNAPLYVPKHLHTESMSQRFPHLLEYRRNKQ